MGDEGDGLPQHTLQAHELVLHLAPDERVERREGLVQEPDVRLHRQGSGDSDALLLSAGKLTWIVALAAFEPDELDHLQRPAFAGALVGALDLKWKRHVRKHRQVWQESEMLEHHAHLVAANLGELILRRLQQVAILEKDFPGRRLDEPRHAAQQRGLAGAGESHDDEYLTLADGEGCVLDRSDDSGGLKHLRVRIAVVLGVDLPGLLAEQLPHPLAADLGRRYGLGSIA